MSSLTIRNAEKHFGATDVLRGVSVDVAPGEFLVLVGPSGCGKSTLLRSIAGLETLTSGELLIGDRRINDLAPADRDIAMVFQSYALYPHMTVAKNMAFALKLRGTPKAEIERRVDEAARILGLDQHLHRLPKELSGGQRQRVAMGRAIVRDPKVFLFDEPLSNLDAKLRVQMRSEIKQLHARLKTTTIYVTHDQVEAMTMADRIVVMRHGVIEQVGPPLELYDHPANTFVATFIGSPAMNLLPGLVQPDGVTFRADSGALLPLPAGGAEAGQRLIYGIRPEHLAIDPAGAIGMQVTLVEPMGHETLCTGVSGEAPISAFVRRRMPISAMDRISFAPDPAHVHLFDESSTNRL